MKHTIRVLGVAIALLVVCDDLAAQQRPTQPPPEQAEPDFARHLFPPELIMQHQQRISLRPEQRTAITGAIQLLQSRVLDLQWQMQTEAQRLSELMQAPTIREEDALAQVDRVLGVEREIKRLHLGTLIRIKNTLSREQQATLTSLR